MGAFQYRAIDMSGRIRDGVMEGDAARQVRSRLRELGLAPLEVRAASGEGRRFRVSSELNAIEVAALTRHLATLLRAGLVLEEALAVLVEQADGARAAKVFAELRSCVVEGQPLANAAEKFPRAFPEFYRRMVEAGERSGKLDEVLERLAGYMERRQDLAQRVSLALIYPALVTLVAVAVVTGLLTYVVPQVTRVFLSSGQALPWATRALLALSRWSRRLMPVVLPAAAAAAVSLAAGLRNESFRRRFDEVLLKAGILGRFLRDVEIARFSSALAILTKSGIPLVSGLQTSARLVTNMSLRAAVELAARRVAEGGSLSGALRERRQFPPMLVHLVANGEATGALGEMLEQSARAQAAEVGGRVAGFVALVEPLLILTMGGIVLFIVLAILSPIIQMNQLVK